MLLDDPNGSAALLLVSAGTSPDAARLRSSAGEIVALLTDRYDWKLPPDRCVLAEPGSPRDAEQALESLAGAATGTLLVCYLGECAVGEDHALFLGLGGTDRADLPGTALPFARLARVVAASPAATRLVVLAGVPADAPAARAGARVGVAATAAGAVPVAEALTGLLRDAPEDDRFTPGVLRDALRDALDVEVRWDEGMVTDPPIPSDDDGGHPPGPPGPPDPPPRRPAWRRWLVAGIVLAAVAAVVLALLTDGGEPPDEVACGERLVLNVLVSADVDAEIRELARQFQAEQLTDGCRRYAVSVYRAAPRDVRDAFDLDWTAPPTDLTADEPFQPTRSVGPPPTVWIPASSAEAWLAGAVPPGGGEPARLDSGAPPVITVGDPLGWSRPVVAVSAQVAQRLRAGRAPDGPDGPGAAGSADEWSWAELLPALATARVDLVRPPATASDAALLHTVALYERLRTDDRIRVLETAVDERVTQDGYTGEDDAQFLCRYAALPAQRDRVALLVSGRALADYRAGDAGCDPAPGEVTALPLSDVAGLDHPFVTVQWPGQRQEQRREAARDFERFLRGPGARAVLERALPDDPADPADRDAVRKTVQTYERLAAPGRVLIALDTSRAMTEPDEALNEGVPLEASKSAIARSLALLGARDEVGLWTFPAAPGPVHEPVGLGPLDEEVAAGRTRQDKLVDTLGGLAADQAPGGSRTYEVIDRGLDALAASRDPAAGDVSALVVITDGRPGSITGEPLSTLQARLAAAGDSGGIAVHVLAFRDGICATLDSTLAEPVDGSVGGSCTRTSPGRIAGDVRDTVSGLWRGVDR